MLVALAVATEEGARDETASWDRRHPRNCPPSPDSPAGRESVGLDTVISRVAGLVGRLRGLPEVTRAELAFRNGSRAGAAGGGGGGVGKKGGSGGRGGAAASASASAADSAAAAASALPADLLFFCSEGDLDDNAALLRGYGRQPTPAQTRELALQLAAVELIVVAHNSAAPRVPLLRLAFPPDDVRIALRGDPLVRVAMGGE